jgi:hypothetical protein
MGERFHKTAFEEGPLRDDGMMDWQHVATEPPSSRSKDEAWTR